MILLTHDVAMITRYAYERLAQDLAMPGVVEFNHLCRWNDHQFDISWAIAVTASKQLEIP